MTIRLPSSVSFWRGNAEGDDIGVFDVIHAMGLGQCDRKILEVMFDDDMQFCDEDDRDELSDDELLTRLVCECGSEREWKSRFRKAYKAMTDEDDL